MRAFINVIQEENVLYTSFLVYYSNFDKPFSLHVNMTSGNFWREKCVYMVYYAHFEYAFAFQN